MKKDDTISNDKLTEHNENKENSKKTITPLLDFINKTKLKSQGKEDSDTTNNDELHTDTNSSAEMKENLETNENDEADASSTNKETEVHSQADATQMHDTKIPLTNPATDETDSKVNNEATNAHEEVTTKLSQMDEEMTHQRKTHEDAKDNIANMLEKLTTTQQQIQKDFQDKLKYDKHKEQTIDTLHRELQEYKDDVVKSTMKPLINDLIFVNDSIYKLVDNLRDSKDPLDPEKILNLMESITTDIDNVLFRQGIESYTCPEEKIDMRKQTIFQTVPINDETKEKHIANRVRKGYEWDEKIIRKEAVSVYVHDDSVSEEEQDAAEKEETDKNTDNEGADKHE